VHDNRTILENRVNREFFERILPAHIARRIPLAVTAHTLEGEPVPFAELVGAGFTPISPGTPWGRPWGTTWFHVTGEVPADLRGDLGGQQVELLVELGFSGAMPGFQAEGAVYVDGRIVCGVHPRRRAVPLHLVTGGGDSSGNRIDFMVEAAANADFVSSFRPNPLGSLRTAGDAPLYTFGGVDLAVVNNDVRGLIMDVELLNELMRTFPLDHPRRRRMQLLFQRAFDALDLDDVATTAGAARSELAPAFEVRAAEGVHEVTAIGHAHMDTAWLWPMRETMRKCARTFANAVQLMDDHPGYRFACSQAQQYEWVRQQHPELFERIRARAAAGQWVPVGGMWVEADMNLPSGESLCRQMVLGQRYFEQHFGRRCDEVWIPDVFGYPGNLPQIFTLGGCTRFVTQKLSWNKQNRFPHNTFRWEGIDGSTVLAHFPPVDTYNAEVIPRELAHSVTNFRDKYWSDHSLMPFGYGDGGGGPTREMLQRVERLADVDGLPRLTIDTPSAFFDAVEAEAADRPVPRWRGELYFEMHRGTFTTQAETKVGNRRCENLLREAELWLATVGDDSHAAELERLWKRVLTDQFHDIIPGSSIAWVHEDAERDHAEVAAACEDLIADTLGRLAPAAPTLANTTTHHRDEVVVATVPAPAPAGAGPTQVLADGRLAFRADVPGLGLAPAVALPVADRVEVASDRLANDSVEVRLDGSGNVVSVRALRFDRELVPAGDATARLTLAPDHPVEFDAWDLEQWTASLAVPLGPAESVEVVDAGPLVGSVRVQRHFGSAGATSTVTQTFVLRAGSARIDVELDIDWHESEKLLAIEFPLDVRADTAACEIQFGLEHRPTHTNTTWDDAKFEVCAHRFVDLSEPGFGVAVLNDGRHGHAVQGVGAAGAGIRVSLLRAPRYPDPEADRGRHRTTVALLPHGPGLTEVLAQAEALNLPVRVVTGTGAATGPAADGSAAAGSATAPTIAAPVIAIDDPRVMASAVKLADDGSGDLVVRVWEATGDRVRTVLRPASPAARAWACNLLEEPLGQGDDGPGDSSSTGDRTGHVGPWVEVVDRAVALDLRPFQVATVRITPA